MWCDMWHWQGKSTRVSTKHVTMLWNAYHYGYNFAYHSANYSTFGRILINNTSTFVNNSSASGLMSVWGASCLNLPRGWHDPTLTATPRAALLTKPGTRTMPMWLRMRLCGCVVWSVVLWCIVWCCTVCHLLRCMHRPCCMVCCCRFCNISCKLRRGVVKWSDLHK